MSSDVEQALAGLRLRRSDGSSAEELAEAERDVALAKHEAKLLPGVAVIVTASGGNVFRSPKRQAPRTHRFDGTLGRIVRRDRGRQWEIEAVDGISTPRHASLGSCPPRATERR